MDRFNRKIAIAVAVIAFFLVFGTFFFHYAEAWSYVDAFYFSGVTLTTVGFGDLVPTHAVSKIAAVFFAFAGLGFVAYSLSVLAQKYIEQEEHRLERVFTKEPAVHPDMHTLKQRVDEMAGHVHILYEHDQLLHKPKMIKRRVR